MHAWMVGCVNVWMRGCMHVFLHTYIHMHTSKETKAAKQIHEQDQHISCESRLFQLRNSRTCSRPFRSLGAVCACTHCPHPQTSSSSIQGWPYGFPSGTSRRAPKSYMPWTLHPVALDPDIGAWRSAILFLMVPRDSKTLYLKSDQGSDSKTHQ